VNLILDLGNTQLKAALFNHKDLIDKALFNYSEKELLVKWLKRKKISKFNLIISSVVNNKLDFGSEFNILKKVELNKDTSIPIKNNYKSPDSLGMDRLSNAVGAWAINPNKNSLVVDLGTCIKYDLISEEGSYLGGNISPGFVMRYKALHHFTDQLPLIKDYDLNVTFGIDTKTSLQCGVQYGIINEINGFIERYTSQFNQLTIFMTGGDAKHFEKSFKNHIFANSNLTLIGLNEILLHNV
jgi:type III pantothenate kinase